MLYRFILILAGFICAVELVFGSLLSVCVVGLFCNVGLCCKCCFYLLSFTIVVFCMWSIFVTSFKEFIIHKTFFCDGNKKILFSIFIRTYWVKYIFTPEKHIVCFFFLC